MKFKPMNNYFLDGFSNENFGAIFILRRFYAIVTCKVFI